KRSAVKKKKTPQKPPLTVKVQKKPVGRKQKKMTKKEEADIVRRDKAAKKARAVQHVEATTALRAAANEKERDRILQEEKDGVGCREKEKEDEHNYPSQQRKESIVLGLVTWMCPLPAKRVAYEAVNSSDDGIDGMVLLAREKSRAKRQLERERLEAAKVKLKRDWNLTTANWDKLTKDEMEVLAQDADALKKMRVDGWNFDASSIPVQNKSYPGLFQGEYEPTEAVSEKAESPIQLFFFLPPRLWLRIASESNKYYHQHLNERVDRIYSKKKAQDPDATREDVMLQETKRHKKIKPEEILHCIGLLVARMLCPHKHRFVDHWANSAKGAVPKGTFGRFMSKARFSRVMQNLHFTDNTDAQAETDRA
ncbi:Hypothetical protein PHPALM_13038, partial [Phytophthora palmivora]